MRIINYMFDFVFISTNYILAKDLYYSEEYKIKFISENIKFKKEESINIIKIKSFKKIINLILTNEEYEKLNK